MSRPFFSKPTREKCAEFIDGLMEKMGGAEDDQFEFFKNTSRDWQTPEFYQECINFTKMWLTSPEDLYRREADRTVVWLLDNVLFVHPAEIAKESHARLVKLVVGLVPEENRAEIATQRRNMLDSEILQMLCAKTPVFDPQALLLKIEEAAAKGHFPRVIIDAYSQKHLVLTKEAQSKADKPHEFIGYWKDAYPIFSMQGFVEFFPESLRQEAKARLFTAFSRKEVLKSFLTDALYSAQKDYREQLIDVRKPLEDIRPFLNKPNVIAECSLTQEESLALLREQCPFKDFLDEYCTDENPHFDSAYRKVMGSSMPMELAFNLQRLLVTEQDKELLGLVSAYKATGLPWNNDTEITALKNSLKGLRELLPSESSPERESAFQALLMTLRGYYTGIEDGMIADLSAGAPNVESKIAVHDDIFNLADQLAPSSLKPDFETLQNIRLSAEIMFHVSNNSDEASFLPVVERISANGKAGNFPSVLCLPMAEKYLKKLPEKVMSDIRSAFRHPQNLNRLLGMSLNTGGFIDRGGVPDYLSIAKLSADDAVHVLAQAYGGKFLKGMAKEATGSLVKSMSKLASSHLWRYVGEDMRKKFSPGTDLSNR
jgi:hypothetical protein